MSDIFFALSKQGFGNTDKTVRFFAEWYNRRLPDFSKQYCNTVVGKS